MKRFFILSLLSVNLIFSQINIESMRNNEKDFQLKIDLNFNSISGNTEYFMINSKLRFDYIKSNYQTFIVGSFSKGEESKELFIDDGFLHWRHIFNYDSSISQEVFLQTGYNSFTYLNSRNLIGTGARFSFYKIKNLTLYIGIGTMYEYESYDHQESEKTLIRSTNYISNEWKISKKLFFSMTNYYQFAFKEISDVRILFTGDLSVNLFKFCSLLFSVNYRFDNQPLDGVKKSDVEILNGLTFLF